LPGKGGISRLVVDASSLISLSGNCMIKILCALSKSAGISFHIPMSVYSEAVERPLTIRRFELSAVRIKDAVDSGCLSVEHGTPETGRLTMEIGDCGNCMNYADGRPLRLIQAGETESLALARTICAKGIVIDERTMRMLAEDPYALRRFLEHRYGRSISLDKRRLSRFRESTQGIPFFRSSEIVALAYERGLFEPELPQEKRALEAALYAVKFEGCAVSMREIDSYLKGVRE